MIIYTSTHIQMYQIVNNLVEPQYVENIPFSLQGKLNIPRNIVVKYYKGKPYICYGTKSIRQIEDAKAKQIIKVINGYAKANNKILYR